MEERLAILASCFPFTLALPTTGEVPVTVIVFPSLVELFGMLGLW